jgi:hypothetical protein
VTCMSLACEPDYMHGQEVKMEKFTKIKFSF